MKDTSVREDLRKHYGDYYRNADLEWRRLGAADKVLNIVSLCRSLPHDSILEIGAGDGAILERLAALGFGRDYRALEISPSAVEVVKSKAIPRLVDCRVFDGYQLPYEDRSLDIAVLSHVLEHVDIRGDCCTKRRALHGTCSLRCPWKTRARPLRTSSSMKPATSTTTLRGQSGGSFNPAASP